MIRPTYPKISTSISPKNVGLDYVPKQHSKEQLRQFQSIFNMIALHLKNNSTTKIHASFIKIKKYTAIKAKYSSFLLNKLHFMQKRKSKEYLRLTWSHLISNKINYYSIKKEQNQKMKVNLKNKSSALIVYMHCKLMKTKMKEYFKQLKNKSLLQSKLLTFKGTHLFCRLNSLQLERQRFAFSKICIYAKYKISSLRRISRIQKLITSKNKHYLVWSISMLKLNVNKIKAKLLSESQSPEEKQVSKPSQVKPNLPSVLDQEKEASIKRLQSEQKALTDKKRQLQKDISRVQNENERTMTQYKNQIAKLENENEGLKFNNGILDEQNHELEKELVNYQKKSRKKLSKNEIWENVYNNLIYFLSSKDQKQLNKNALIDCLEVPLVPCNLNIDELADQNKVLSELLEEYKKSFPLPEAKNDDPLTSPELLPFDVIRRQNRYYYMVLEVLSEWGMAGSKQLEQLNNDLTSLQKKIS